MRPTPLILAVAAALLLAAPAPASTTQSSIFEAPRELLGSNDALRQKTLDEIRAFGVRRIRVLVIWSSVERTRGIYDLSRYDAIISEANARGIEVIPTLTGPAPGGSVRKPDRNRYEKFVEAVGRAYADQVRVWTIWNEPNQPQFLKPQFAHGKPYSPHLYRALYQAALQGLGASGNGGDRVLAGETSPAGNRHIVAPVTFARIFFAGRKLKVDGWAHHPYTKKAGPFYKPHSRNDVTIGALGRLTHALDRYSKHRRMKLWLTEFGIQSKPDPNYGVSETKQAEYRSISEKIAYDNPRVAAISQYLMRDDKPRSGADRYGGFESGLRYANGRKKKSYAAYRLPLVARKRGHGVRLWGIARPADGATTVTVEYRDHHGWKGLANVVTDGRRVWSRKTRYRRGRTYRVRWGAFAGPATHVYS